jgi:hypothetical protein
MMSLFEVTCYIDIYQSKTEIWQASDIEQLCQSLSKTLPHWQDSGNWEIGKEEAIYSVKNKNSFFAIKIIQTKINLFKFFWLKTLNKIH